MLLWFLLGGAVGYGMVRVWWGYPRPDPPCSLLAPREVALLRAAGDAAFPPGGAIPTSGSEADVAGYADRWLAVLPARMRLLMRLLFFGVEHATLFFPAPGPRGWRRFSSLRPEQQRAVLEGWRRSRLYPRRLVFVSLRAILGMGYLAHPRVLRQLGLAPLEVDTPICEADLLYPPIGRGPAAIRYSRADLKPACPSPPLEPGGPLHPRYAEKAS